MKEKSEILAYRWVILAVAWWCFFVLAMSWYIMPTLEHQLLRIYNINSAQYSTALTVPFLIAGLLALAGGMLADHLGIRKAASLGIVIAGIGILLRANTGEFMSLMVPMMIVGMGMGLIMPNLPKLVNIWFPPEETGLATGIYNTGLMGGLSTGLVIAPYLPGWSRGNLLLGILIIISGLIFFLIVRDAPPGKEIPSSPLLEGISTAVRSKNSWLATFAIFMAMAGMVSFQGAFPGGLNKVYNLPMITGGRITSLISYLGIVGSLTLPIFANKLGQRRLFITVLPFAFSITMYVTWILGNNATVLWVGTAVAGYLAGGTLPLIMEIPAFLPRIENDPVQPQHVGGVSGMISSLMNIGGFIGLPFIVMPVIIAFGYTRGFLVATIIFAAQAIFAMFIDFPESGTVLDQGKDGL